MATTFNRNQIVDRAGRSLWACRVKESGLLCLVIGSHKTPSCVSAHGKALEYDVFWFHSAEFKFCAKHVWLLTFSYILAKNIFVDERALLPVCERNPA